MFYDLCDLDEFDCANSVDNIISKDYNSAQNQTRTKFELVQCTL